MNILQELNALLSPILPVETGVFSGPPPGQYAVLTPLTDGFALYTDNKPSMDISEVRISLFTQGNYLPLKTQITSVLLQSEFTITDRRYVNHEDETGYHHLAIDVAKEYTIT